MARLDGKVAIVTGAGRPGNIGVAICEAYLREGAIVLATDLRGEFRSEVEQKLASYGQGRFRFEHHDVTSEADWARVAEVAKSAFGQLDVLVNNVGIGANGSVRTTSLADFRHLMAVNLDSILIGMQTCAPLLASARERFRGGSIINTLSMASYLPRGVNMAYQVSKAAGRMLTLCAADEFGPDLIRVNSVHPGVTETPLLREGFDSYVQRGVYKSTDEAMRVLVDRSLLKQAGTPEDLAHAYVYLASDESAQVTGAALYHDGGVGRQY
jgi:NAD(P)-dependent dehydrogenase (short-subunit alcohol dehydrogenase family)